MAKHSEKGESPATEAKVHSRSFLKTAVSKAARFGKEKKHGEGKSRAKGGKY